MTIEEVLVKQYGPLLSLDELATILDRSPQGLRMSQLFEKAVANFMGIFPGEFRGWLCRDATRKIPVPGKRY
jgi:hypothetical protein